MNQINFCHDYYKLKNKTFTTIRGASNFKKYRIGEVVEITINRTLLFTAKIANLEICKISQIPLAVLKKDAEYSGFEIKNHEDFMRLINSFRRFSKIKNLDDKMLVITLEKEGKGE